MLHFRRRLVALGIGSLLFCCAASGCSSVPKSDPDQVSTQILPLPEVIAASASVSEPGFLGTPSALRVSVDVDSGISDPDLVALDQSIDEVISAAGWGDDSISILAVGPGRTVATRHDTAPIAIFNLLRHDDRYVTVDSDSTGSPCATTVFCVTMNQTDPAALARESQRLGELCASVNSDPIPRGFEVRSVDGRFGAEADPSAPTEDGLALWSQIVAAVPVTRMSLQAFSSSTEESQHLSVGVADAADEVAVRRIASAQDVVDVSVTITSH